MLFVLIKKYETLRCLANSLNAPVSSVTQKYSQIGSETVKIPKNNKQQKMDFQAYPIAINIEVKQENVVKPTIINCAFCNQTFHNKKDLKDHKSREHQQIAQEPRQKKTKSNALVPNYVPHQPRFQCEYCFKGFDQSHRLKQHQISHREPVYECDQVS
jgi:uncharacterized Zn-finger protein